MPIHSVILSKIAQRLSPKDLCVQRSRGLQNMRAADGPDPSAALRLLRMTTVCLTAITLTLSTAHAAPKPSPYKPPSLTRSYTDMGGVGLIQMPNARFQEDGHLYLGYSSIFPYDRTALTVQALPWLEATFRITEIDNRFEPSSLFFDPEGQSFFDRGLDFKVRLVEEGEYTPEIAVGVRDVGGTTLFSSEYLVATRRYYNWDFTGGIAWGNMGSRGHLSNPFADVADSFSSRGNEGRTGGTAGSFQNSFFKGDRIGLFGGIEYQIPNYGVRFKLEYDGNDYQSEPLSNRFEVDSPINAGIEYHPYNWLHLAASWQRGNEAMFRIGLNQSLKQAAAMPKLLDEPPVKVLPRSEIDLTPLTLDHITKPCLQKNGVQEDADVKLVRVENSMAIFHLNNNCRPDSLEFQRELALQLAGIEGIQTYKFYWQGMIEVASIAAENLQVHHLYDQLATAYVAKKELTDQQRLLTEEKLAAALAEKGFSVNAINFTAHDATVWISQGKFRRVPQAAGRAARIIANHSPSNIKNIHIVFLESGLTASKITIARDDVKALSTAPQLAWQHTEITNTDAGYQHAEYINEKRYPAFNWSITPGYRQNFGGPDAYYVYQIYLSLSASYQPFKGLIFSGNYAQNIFNTFDELQLESTSVLPKVRSDIKNYLQQGDSGINSLQAAYLFDIAPSWYGKADAGLYELMYGGVGGEVLYAPLGKPWAIGADYHYVRQRDFDARFSFRDYDITTGHVNFYYDLPFYNMHAEVNVGRYLAGDDGATLTLSRQFDSGVELGVFATMTDVPAEKFGEGNFDKGFYVSFPLDMFFVKTSKSRRAVVFRPVTRDGGAKLGQSRRLYPLLKNHRQRKLDRDWKYIAE